MLRRAGLLVLLPGMLAVAACTSSSTDPPPPVPCETDAIEPNETVLAATNLGEIKDDDEIGQGKSAPPNKIDRTFSTHEGSDIDWFVVDVRDTGIGGNPQLRVIVGEGHEATAFWSCSSGATSAVCGLGTQVTNDPDLPSTRGCLSAKGAASPQLTMTIECDGTSTDSGRLHIRVKKTSAATTCERYRLIVSAE